MWKGKLLQRFGTFIKGRFSSCPFTAVSGVGQQTPHCYLNSSTVRRGHINAAVIVLMAVQEDICSSIAFGDPKCI